jgi:hypothetical protein
VYAEAQGHPSIPNAETGATLPPQYGKSRHVSDEGDDEIWDSLFPRFLNVLGLTAILSAAVLITAVL